MNRFYIITVSFFVLLFVACNQNTPQETVEEKKDSIALTPSEINPNGASELAKLMRTMESQTETWKKEIEEDKAQLSSMPFVYNTLKTAQATNDEMKNENFDAFADDFVSYSNALVKAPLAERKQAFNTMVGGCMACHDQMCPGPIKRIQKFYFK